MQRGKAEEQGENVSLKPTNGSVLIPSLQRLSAAGNGQRWVEVDN
jgi:hypothetical protein